MIIHSGLMPDFWNASSTFRRLAIFLILVSELVAASSSRSVSISLLQIEAAQQLAYALRAHHRGEIVAELLRPWRGSRPRS